MKNKRYGIIRVHDCLGTWLGVVFFAMVAIASILLEQSVGYILFPMLFAVIWMRNLLLQINEKFEICNDSIAVFSGRTTRSIALPAELTLVISYADISPLMRPRIATGKHSHMLKDRYAFSIIQGISAADMKEKFHHSFLYNYSLSTIRAVVQEHQYLYGFVCNQQLLEQLLSIRKCTLLIPESLIEKITIDQAKTEIIIDSSY